MSEPFQQLVDTLGDEGGFLDRHPYPALVLEPKGASSDSAGIDTGRWKLGAAHEETRPIPPDEEEGDATCVLAPTASKQVFSAPTDLVDPRATVAWLVKSDRNPFAALITLGRARNNDIVLDDGSISKMHAVVQRETGGNWSIQDWGSTNGTWLNALKLPAKEKHVLEDGSQLRFGGGLNARFFSPETLYRFASLIKGE